MGCLDNATIIGITGSFGSGSTTFAGQLEDDYGFKSIKLSKYLVEEAKSRGFKVEEMGIASRELLQDIGNELRQSNGNHYLAEQASSELEKTFPDHNKFVLDGIRNPGEIDFLKRYSNFYLLAVDCDAEERFRRLVQHKKYKETDRKIFDRDDLRDKAEAFPYGQQVLRCVENADVFISNDKAKKTAPIYRERITEVLKEYVELILGTKIREAYESEIMMSLASLFSLQSRCIKRQVGAVLIDQESNIISVEYNKVPGREKACIDGIGGCYRELLRYKERTKWLESVKFCNSCGGEVSGNDICPTCNSQISYPIPKMLDKCYAVHAEEAALLSATKTNSQLKASTLFTTTYPCMQCSKRIIQKGVSKVVYTDPYPDQDSIEMLEEAAKSGDIIVERFQGVKAIGFYRIFSRKMESLREKAIEGRAFFDDREESKQIGKKG